MRENIRNLKHSYNYTI